MASVRRFRRLVPAAIAHLDVGRHCTVTRGLKNCRNTYMQNRIRFVRLALTALGVWTVIQSFIVIFRAINQWRGWQGDALSDASIVALLLGVLLALGGGCLALRGIKYQSPAVQPEH